MHAPYDKSRKGSYRTEPKGNVGFLVLFVIVAFVVLVVTAVHPKASLWIAQAVEAEFGGGITNGDVPTQIVQPDMAAPIQTVRVD